MLVHIASIQAPVQVSMKDYHWNIVSYDFQGTFQGIFQNVDNVSVFGGTFTNVYHEKTDHTDSSNHLVSDILFNGFGWT